MKAWAMLGSDSEAAPKQIKVLIGQVSLTRHPNVLSSVLGSCIGLVIFDDGIGLAGMAHVLLPNSNGKPPPNGLPGKFADHAVSCLIEGLKKHGARPSALKAKVAGGAKMFTGKLAYKQKDVGSANVDAVMQCLLAEHIPVVGQDTGGSKGRRVSLAIDTWAYTVDRFDSGSVVI